MRSRDEILAGMTDSNGNILRSTTHEKLLIETLFDIRELLANPPLIRVSDMALPEPDASQGCCCNRNNPFCFKDCPCQRCHSQQGDKAEGV